MKAAACMAAAAIGSALAIVAIAGRARAAGVLLGMLAPLAATTVSWVVTERTYTRDPERLTATMIAAFAAKVVLFGVYVAWVIGVVGLDPTPFVVSFTGYFIALYFTEALLMRRLFAKTAERRHAAFER
jgi:hypothetical protein